MIFLLMASVNFLYRSTRDYAPLKLRLLYRHKSIDYQFETKTKVLIEKDYWLNHHNTKRSRDIDIINKQVEVNEELTKLRRLVIEAFNSIGDDYINSMVNKEWLHSLIYKFYNPPVKNSSLPRGLSDYFEYYIKVRTPDLANQTLKNYKVVFKLLKKYEQELKENILIKDIDFDFKISFQNFCLKNDYTNNTISRAIGYIKTICKHAQMRGLKISSEISQLKIKEVKSPIIFLTNYEINSIENAVLTKKHLLNARDWLIISCFTAQRISDFMEFTKDMIRIEKGKYLLEFTQKKTSKIMTISLHPKVLEILEKYNGDFPPKLQNQKYNKYIKEVCRVAGICHKIKGNLKIEMEKGSKKYRKVEGDYEKWRLVSSHIGRRSFASNYYGEMPTPFIMYMTGHKTEKMLLNYIGKSDKDIALELTQYF